MDLSSEDALRLNVLLANNPQAIRIDESSMTLYGLSEKGEAKVTLNPNCRDDIYLRKVREVLSGHVLGSPGGYPIYLKRWSRMGQTRDESLEQLLLLGEPEAVVAVSGAYGLSDELARRAWWTQQDPDNARRMLAIPAVVEGKMGPELARFLIEYLPFETEPLLIVESLRLSLQPGLVDEKTRTDLWKRCQRKPTYFLGFLGSMPDDLPGELAGRLLTDSEEMQKLSDVGNPFAAQLLRICSPAGQNFLDTVLRVMEKPANQDVVTLLLDILRDYLSPLRPSGDPDLDWSALAVEADECDDPLLNAAIAVLPERERELRSLYLLSGIGYGIVRPVFSKTDAIGSLMRKKLQPVFEPLRERLTFLLD
ncbi:MAG: sulfur reduction protein DsrS [Candidatus Thiodiazotropha sp. (ex Monitilora ramsayi)]|nr:sulfur reduction protein DsrS [Candidatus Thiodiazotropha sp. (ex Monitilora ramsayi)]